MYLTIYFYPKVQYLSRMADIVLIYILYICKKKNFSLQLLLTRKNCKIHEIYSKMCYVTFYSQTISISFSNLLCNLILMQDVKKVYKNELEEMKSLVTGLGLDLNRRLNELENVCKL